MATAKLRKIDTIEGLSPYEKELLNWNFWAIEQALNSLGAVTPDSTGTPPLSIPIRHDQLLELSDDDHLQYLLLAGRVGGQTIFDIVTVRGSLIVQIADANAATADSMAIVQRSGQTGDLFQILTSGSTFYWRVRTTGQLIFGDTSTTVGAINFRTNSPYLNFRASSGIGTEINLAQFQSTPLGFTGFDSSRTLSLLHSSDPFLITGSGGEIISFFTTGASFDNGTGRISTNHMILSGHYPSFGLTPNARFAQKQGTDIIVDFASASFTGNVSITGTLTGGGGPWQPLDTDLTTLAAGGTANQVPAMNAAGTNIAFRTLVAGTNMAITHAAGSITFDAAGGVGAHDILSASHSDTLAAGVVLGDLIHGNATPKWARLAGDTTNTRKFLRTLSTAGVAQIPAWDTILEADITDGTILARVAANETITGVWVFDSGGSSTIFSGSNGDLLVTLYDEDNTGSISLNIQGAQVADIVVSLPAAGGDYTLVGTSNVQTLTNKRLDVIKNDASTSGKPCVAGSGANPPASGFMGSVTLTGQGGTGIAATNLTNGTSAGLYAIYYYMECTTADATPELDTVTLQFDYTDRNGATNQVTTALAMNVVSTGTTAVSGVKVLRLHSGNIQYKTTITGVGDGTLATAKYALTIRPVFMGT